LAIVTPAEHAATVREDSDLLARACSLSQTNLDWPKALDRITALAERATELEAKCERQGTNIQALYKQKRAAEACATELERERDFWKQAKEEEHRTRHAVEDTIARERERAERAAT
jgi:chromosome segregation ATPase